MASVAVDQMLADGTLDALAGAELEAFVEAPGLGVLLAGDFDNPHGEGHDVAVALRELLREHGGAVRAGLVAEAKDRAVQRSLRVSVLPSLVFVAGGQVLEVVPRVRDWAEYTQAFRRYLGAPVRLVGSLSSQAQEVRP